MSKDHDIQSAAYEQEAIKRAPRWNRQTPAQIIADAQRGESDAAYEQAAPINVLCRIGNLSESIDALNEYLLDNQAETTSKGLERFALAKWDGLDLTDIERKVCEAVVALDLLAGRETRPVIFYTLTGETDADDA